MGSITIQQHLDIVQCDRCKKTNLLACINWKDNDLCLKCSYIVSKNLEAPVKDRDYSDCTFMCQDTFRPHLAPAHPYGDPTYMGRSVKTNMQQDMFNQRNREQNVPTTHIHQQQTRMMQNMFNTLAEVPFNLEQSIKRDMEKIDSNQTYMHQDLFKK